MVMPEAACCRLWQSIHTPGLSARNPISYSSPGATFTVFVHNGLLVVGRVQLAVDPERHPWRAVVEAEEATSYRSGSRLCTARDAPAPIAGSTPNPTTSAHRTSRRTRGASGPPAGHDGPLDPDRDGGRHGDDRQPGAQRPEVRRLWRDPEDEVQVDRGRHRHHVDRSRHRHHVDRGRQRAWPTTPGVPRRSHRWGRAGPGRAGYRPVELKDRGRTCCVRHQGLPWTPHRRSAQAVFLPEDQRR